MWSGADKKQLIIYKYYSYRYCLQVFSFGECLRIRGGPKDVADLCGWRYLSSDSAMKINLLIPISAHKYNSVSFIPDWRQLVKTLSMASPEGLAYTSPCYTWFVGKNYNKQSVMIHLL